jgi:hypothetical protein
MLAAQELGDGLEFCGRLKVSKVVCAFCIPEKAAMLTSIEAWHTRFKPLAFSPCRPPRRGLTAFLHGQLQRQENTH